MYSEVTMSYPRRYSSVGYWTSCDVTSARLWRTGCCLSGSGWFDSTTFHCTATKYQYQHWNSNCVGNTEMSWGKLFLRGAADKSLAWPGRKQASATKPGIYSTYSPRSSVHFLALCSNFCKPLKKIQNIIRPTRSPRQQWPPRRTKNGDLSTIFSVQGTGGSPTGPDPENRVGDQGTEAQVGQFLLGCKCPVSRGIVVQEQDPLGDFPRRFSFKMSFNCTSRDE